jgi:acyl carrier protein
VRPTGKSERPDVEFADWCARRRMDGTAEDPWIRLHERVGGRVLTVGHASQRVVAPLEDWERWAGRRLDGETSVHVAGTLGPVILDHATRVGVYEEPCLWMEHPATRVLAWQPLEAEHLRQHLRSRVPDYMVPDTIRFSAELPTTPSGKLDEQALRARHRVDDAVKGRTVAAPRTALQATLVAIWSELLGVHEVGVDDDFFDLGGHSLAAVRMLSRLKQQLALEVTLRAFFRARTIARLEDLILTLRAQ